MTRGAPLRPRRLALVRWLLLAVLVGTGCEDSVDPTTGLDVPFSLYGQLDPTADRQAIRVSTIATSIDADSLAIDAAVTSTDLGTGAVTAWRDSLVTFADGQTGHVFVADFTPRPASTVRIEARRSDGAVSAVDVAVPAIVEPTVSDERFFEGGLGYSVRVDGAPGVLSGELSVTVAGHPDDPPGTPRRIVIPLPPARVPERLGGDEWGLEVPFVAATREHLQLLGLYRTGLGLIHAEYAMFVTGPDWTPPSTDPDVLVEPGTFSNVEAGLGFVGSGYTARARWLPSASAISGAGFTPGGDPAEALVLNEVMPGADPWIEIYNPSIAPVSLVGYSLSDSAEDPFRQRLPGIVVGAGEFLVVPLAFAVPPEVATTITLSTIAGRPVLSETTDPLADGVVASYGSFPDGYSNVIRRTVGLQERRYDLFKGPLEPTPAAPNRVGLAWSFLNEIQTAGADGWVEVVTVAPGADSLRVLAEQGAPGTGWLSASRAVPAGGPFAVAPETPLGLPLGQVGGGVVLLAYITDERIRPEPNEVVDALDRQIQFRALDRHAYGPQTPGRTEGRLPDATGPWAPDLRPTRGAPNAPARLGL